MLQMINEVSNVRKIGYVVCLCVICFGLGYFLTPSTPSKIVTKTVTVKELVKTNVRTRQVATTSRGVTRVVTDTLLNQTSNTDMEEFNKTEINVRKYDVLVTYGRDLDNSTNIVGGQFIFEPVKNVLLGAGYQRNLNIKSNVMLFSTGLRF